MIKKATILLIGLVFLVSTVQAGSPAIVTKDFVCPGVAIVSGEITAFPLEGKEVISTKDMMTCKGILPEYIPRPAQTVHLDYASIPGVQFSLSSGFTADWKEEITPSGHVTLTVKFNPDSTP